MSVSSVSIYKTPQAGDDWKRVYEGDWSVIDIDVLSNDLGGKAKTLYSLDNGDKVSDLLDPDAKAESMSTDVSANGARIWIGTDNKVYYDPNTLTDAFKARIEAQAQGEETVEDTFTYAVRMGNGTLSWATVTIKYSGTNDAPVISIQAGDSDSSSIGEDSGLQATGTLTVRDADNSDVVDLEITDVQVSGNVQGSPDFASMFTLTSDIDDLAANSADANNIGWFFNGSAVDFNYLAAGQSVVITYTITARDFSSDGATARGGSDTQSVTITITGTNDGPVAVVDSGSAGENETKSFDVLLNDTDVDVGDTKTLDSLGTVTVTSANGAVHGIDASGAFSIVGNQLKFTPGSLFDGLDHNDSATVTVAYTMKDSQGATSSSTLTLTVNGANDAPALTGTQATLANGTEDTVYVIDPADLLAGFTDVDLGNVLAVANLTANHGTLTLRLDGKYEFAPDANYFGPVTLNYNVVDGFGGIVAATQNFSLAAVNDPAVIGGDDAGAVTEAGALSAGDPDDQGTLTAADVDNPPNTFQVAAGNSAYGSYTINASGQWNYLLNNANPVVNALVAGAILMDSFIVYSADGTAHTVNITITGADDTVVVTGPATETGADPNDFDTLSGGIVVSGNHNAGNGSDTFTGDAGDQTLNGGGGNDVIYGAGGNDNIDGGNDDDTLYGQAGDDSISGNNGVDTLYGGSGADDLVGGNQADTIYGGSGNDTIVGNNGNDIIIGGYGADMLTGGGDNDTFKYLDVKDTNDTILDFMVSGSDFIDLSAIDANPSTALNDAFAWGGTTPTARGAWYSEGGGNTVLYADTDGNAATAEFMVTLQGFTGWGTLYDQPIEGPPPGVIL